MLVVEIICLYSIIIISSNSSWVSTFRNSVPTCPGNISVFLFGCFSLLPPQMQKGRVWKSGVPCSAKLASCYTCSASWTSGWTVLVLWGGCPWRSRNFRGFLPSRADSQEILPTSSLSKPKSTCTKFSVIIILHTFPNSLRFLHSHLTILQSSHSKTVLISWAASSTVLPSVSSPSTSMKKVSLTHSESLLNCLCPITLPFQQMWGGLQFS